MKIRTPVNIEEIEKLKIGDRVYITGYIYTARDSAHKKMIESLNSGEKLPFDIENQIIYYVGPCPAKPNEIIGSAGPTTSFRMDAYTPTLLDLGLKGMIGKGSRNDEVIESIKKNKAVYLGAGGGLGALIASKIKSVEIIAYEELGPEAIRKIYVEDFPAIVLVDSEGRDIFNRD
ncbi:MAG: Fe-S-containing hydro-lyase [Andreesenia angusta]|nr:Fe-S-containing hydro-lyase [Andreesenia angusta]